MKDIEICALYLDYFNHFLSVSCFAENHGMTKQNAEKTIIQGIKLENNADSDFRKEAYNLYAKKYLPVRKNQQTTIHYHK